MLEIFQRAPTAFFDDETARGALTKFRHQKKHMGLVQRVPNARRWGTLGLMRPFVLTI